MFAKDALVIMATFNGEQWVIDQIRSILNQTYKSIELLIFDDHSTDSTVDLIKNNYPAIQVILRKKNLGSAARNFLDALSSIDLTTYKYVFFSDQDDIWINDKVEKSIRCLTINNYEAYSSNVLAFWGSDLSNSKINDKSYKQVKYDHLFESAGPGCTYLLSVNLATQIQKFIIKNGFISINHHDWFIYSFARSRGFSWFIDSCPSVYYRQHSSNFIGDNIGFMAYYKRFKQVYKGNYRNQVNSNIDYLQYKHDFKRKINSRFFLFWNFFQLRRNPRDKLVILFFILICIY